MFLQLEIEFKTYLQCLEGFFSYYFPTKNKFFTLFMVYLQ